MLGMAIAFIIGGSVGVVGMGAWCGAAVDRLRGQRDRLKAAVDAHIKNYAAEYRKRLEVEETLRKLGEDRADVRRRIESVVSLIDSIPHCKGKETRIKAMLRGEAA